MEPVLKASFKDRPCQCVTRHNPIVHSVELHHTFPQEFQKKRYGKVVDQTTVPLCGTAHENIHLALRKWMKGEEFKLGNRHQQRIALEGYRRIREG